MTEFDDFKLSSDLTVHNVKLDRDRLLQHLKNSSIEKLRFDLSSVNRCDSAGLALLIEAKRICDNKKLQYSFYGIPKEVNSLAEFCGVKEIFL